jgi:nicotinamidase-related amidase
MTNIAIAGQSQLVLIDVQVKLCDAMLATDMQAVSDNCGRLIQAANLLAVPVVVTEQYPQGLGATIPEIAQYFGNTKPIAKTSFSAYADSAFKAKLQRDKSQIILAGMEAHICVLQTACDLMAQGKQVMVVEDAIISRNAANRSNAIARMANAGAVITNTESVLYEWLGDAKHASFKAIAKLIK